MEFTIDEDLIERVKESNSIVDLISEYVKLNRSGSNYLGLCPFHNEKTPSFSVSPSRQYYHCFGCGEGGDLINFIMKKENLSFIDAVKYLADRSGIELREKSQEDLERDKKKEKIYEINRAAARYFYINLSKSIAAQNYLKHRGINIQIIKKFGLGYSMDSWSGLMEELKSKGYSDKDLEMAGLVGRTRDGERLYDKFRNRIIFPIIDLQSRVIGFGGRVLDDAMPKYLNSQDSLAFSKGHNLYGLNLIRERKDRERIILVEGYMDVISLYSYGFSYAVASLGTAFTESQAKLLSRYGNQVYICYDSDAAGEKATEKALEVLREIGVDARVILLPKGFDPDDYIKRYNREAFEDLLNKALNYFEYHMYRGKKDLDLGRPKDKILFARRLSNLVKSYESPVEREVYIEEIARETDLSKEAIEREVYSQGRSYPEDKRDQPKPRIDKSLDKVRLLPAYIEGERILLRLAFLKRDYYETIYKGLDEKRLISERMNHIFSGLDWLYEELEKDSINKDDLINKSDYKGYIEEIDSIFNFNLELLENYSDTIKELTNLINKTELENKRQRIAKDIKLAEESNDFRLVSELCLELIEVDKRLKN